MYGTGEREDLDRRVDEIYKNYVEVIAPFIIQLEVLDGEFPVEMLNEIRAIFTHIARCRISEDRAYSADNITKAERHMKRAVFDGYKHLCVTYDEYYKEFDNQYKNVDLSVVDNGDFLRDMSRMRTTAVEKLEEARRCEVSCGDDDEVYTLYNDAYNAYSDLHNLVKGSREKIEIAKRRASRRDKLAVAGFVVGVVGLIVGMVGTVAGVLGLFIPKT